MEEDKVETKVEVNPHITRLEDEISKKLCEVEAFGDIGDIDKAQVSNIYWKVFLLVIIYLHRK